MKRTLIASLVASAFALPAHATPASFVDELLSSVLPSLEESIVIERDVILAAADEARTHSEAMRRWSEDFAQEMRTNLTTMYAPRLASSRVVKGAPYSAEVVTETNQSLADGNVITRKTVGAIYRDAEGRTRQESAVDGKKQSAVYINDPVDSKHIVLIPESKRAIVTPRVMPMAHELIDKAKEKVKEGKEKRVMKFGATEIRIEDGHVFVDGKEATDGKVELKNGNRDIRVEDGKVTIDGREIAPGHPRVVVRSVDEKETGDGTRREEIRVQVVRAGDRDVIVPMPPMPPMPPMGVDAIPPIPPLPPMPGVQTLRFESTARLGKGVTTQIGAKDFDGVRAEGKSTVWTIPAGEIGNRSPIQVSSESWYSPDLKVTVYSRYSDPRTGESIYRLANIRRAEPARDLFTVPEGYDTKGRGKKEEKK